MDPRIVPLLRPLITEPEQVPAIKPFNMQMKVLLTTEDTAGAVSVIMAWHKPGEGPPDHVHFDQEETFFIVDGRYELTIDGQTSIDGPGTLVFIPRNIVHSFKNVGETSACRLDWTLPGGQDRYFKKISELAAGGSLTGDKLAELNKEHNTTFCSARRPAADGRRERISSPAPMDTIDNVFSVRSHDGRFPSSECCYRAREANSSGRVSA